MRRRVLINLAIPVLLLALVAVAPTKASSARSIGGKLRTGAPVGKPMSALLCAWHLDKGRSQGAMAWVVPLTSSEGDGQHGFALQTERGRVDIDGGTFVEFFAAQKPCVGARPLSPVSEAYPSDREDARGFVPRGATHAVVFTETFFFAGLCYLPCGRTDFAFDRPFRLTITG